MCHVSQSVRPDFYERATRSVRLGGYVTSVGLEEEFWAVLEALAAEQAMSMGALLTTLYDEYLRADAASNFTSFLRVSCIVAVRERGARGGALQGLHVESASV